MQRPIKFRAWIRTEKRIVSVSNLRFIDGVVSISYGGDFHVYYNQEEIELMQFTSLKDKNGKEIWEGDIVRGVGIHHGQSEVFFDYGRYWPFAYLGTFNGNEFEIIGNIYENPELLEGGNP